VNKFVQRTMSAALVLLMTALAVTAFATPCAADPVTTTTAERPSISQLSPASMQVLRAAVPAPRTQDATPPSAGGFFKSRKGAVALGLIAAGIGFTIWSAIDSKEPVASPVR
jgi:hypothetical protein